MVVVVLVMQVQDCVTGEQWSVKAKSVINATGVFADAIR